MRGSLPLERLGAGALELAIRIQGAKRVWVIQRRLGGTRGRRKEVLPRTHNNRLAEKQFRGAGGRGAAVLNRHIREKLRIRRPALGGTHRGRRRRGRTGWCRKGSPPAGMPILELPILRYQGGRGGWERGQGGAWTTTPTIKGHAGRRRADVQERHHI